MKLQKEIELLERKLELLKEIKDIQDSLCQVSIPSVWYPPVTYPTYPDVTYYDSTSCIITSDNSEYNEETQYPSRLEDVDPVIRGIMCSNACTPFS